MNGSEPAGPPPLKPQELDQALGLDAASRAEWMLEDLARWERAWGLTNAEGWVVYRWSDAPPSLQPWVLPLWPRQELAALAARDGAERPQSVPLDELLDELLPQLAQRGWSLLTCPDPQGTGSVEDPLLWQKKMRDSWDEFLDDEA